MGFGATFLVDPPMALARPPMTFGDRSLTLALPGGPYRLSGLSPLQHDVLGHRWSAFTSVAPHTVQLDVALAPSADFRAVDTRGWSYELDLEYREHDVRLAGLGIVGRLQRRGTPMWAEARLTADDALYFPGQIENVLRVAVAYRLLASGGLLVHAASVLVDGGAQLFVGRSTAGKSTLARFCLEAGLTVLGDDLAALVPTNEGRWLVAPVPFAGDLPVPHHLAPTPLTAVNLLVQSQRNQRTRVGRARVVSALLATAAWVNRDPLAGDSVLNVCSAVAAHGSRASAFEFTLDGRAAADLVWREE